MEYSDAATSAAGGAIALVGLLMIAVFYAYFSLCFQMIAKRTGTPNGWLAWIPVVNIILLLQIAQKPLWWVILFLIPFVNLIVSIMVFMEIAKRCGKPEWVGVLMIVPGIQIIVPGYLAFSK